MDMLKMRVSTVLAIALTISLILLGIVGLVLSYFNPLNWIPYTVPCIDYVGCWIQPSLVYLSGVIDTLNSNWLITLPMSLLLFAMGLLQPESRRNIRAFPRKVINAYRRVMVWRDKAFSFIERLNTESVKWKRTFNVLKSPYSLLRACGVSPQLAVTFLSIGSVAGGGAIVNETILSERSFSNGDSGIYLAPSDAPTTYNDGDNTLAINLGAIAVKEIVLENISAGEIYTGGPAAGNPSVIPSVCDATTPAKSGNAKCPAILVSGLPAVAASGDTPAFVATRITIGTLIVESSRCRTMKFENIDAHTVIIDSNTSDGLSIYQEAGTAPNRTAMGGFHMASKMHTEGGTYDRLLISSPTSGVNGAIGVLKISNVFTKGGGGCVFNALDIGLLKIIQNESGHDSSLLTKEFVITDVQGANWTVTNNVELILPEPALQNANP